MHEPLTDLEILLQFNLACERNGVRSKLSGTLESPGYSFKLAKESMFDGFMFGFDEKDSLLSSIRAMLLTIFFISVENRNRLAQMIRECNFLFEGVPASEITNLMETQRIKVEINLGSFRDIEVVKQWMMEKTEMLIDIFSDMGYENLDGALEVLYGMTRSIPTY